MYGEIGLNYEPMPIQHNNYRTGPKFLLILFPVIIFSCLYGCSSKKSPEEQNIINLLTKSGWIVKTCFPQINCRDTVLSFVSENNFDTTTPIYYKVYFNDDGTMLYRLHHDPELGFCGNGMFYVKDANWELESRELELNINGGYSLLRKFEYDIIYRIDMIDENELKLVKVEEVDFTELEF
jgi:hypothetical protein